MEINISDYLTNEEIKDIVKENISRCVKQHYSKEHELNRLISNLSYECLFNAINEVIDGDIRYFLKEKIAEIINEKSSISFELFRKGDYFGGEEGAGITIIKDILREKKDDIKNIILEKFQEENIEEYIEETIKESVLDVICEKLFNK